MVFFLLVKNNQQLDFIFPIMASETKTKLCSKHNHIKNEPSQYNRVLIEQLYFLDQKLDILLPTLHIKDHFEHAKAIVKQMKLIRDSSICFQFNDLNKYEEDAIQWMYAYLILFDKRLKILSFAIENRDVGSFNIPSIPVPDEYPAGQGCIFK